MHIFKSTVGRKILMSVSGQLLILFVLVHLMGNSAIFLGPSVINGYAEHLNSLLPLVWSMRVAMLIALLVHVTYGVQLTLENKEAKPKGYAVQRQLRANFASRNMIWTGVLLALFIAYHLLQFTFKVTPEVAALTATIGRYDVYAMVVTTLRRGVIAATYIFAMVMLYLHLRHGIPSFLQTMGWNNARTLSPISAMGKAVSALLMLGYMAIPVTILFGVLNI
ncbi:succinate dehydrogenase cytochrome b subunit [Geomonas sp. RF6]|uniref:succinate dehydrogenase cytochrome b subunit n=1 Tax=Geomonas sp. RF6 TaxID=2897342 RepID=UPI001E33DA50|nr:succinate dehydrogenase cytochrome b subunit [Geomonas sp. RF6]UFS68608.1 succinate dehydrogenase cytochrome b subunit [Geomonas sp. RF6]